MSDQLIALSNRPDQVLFRFPIVLNIILPLLSIHLILPFQIVVIQETF